MSMGRLSSRGVPSIRIQFMIFDVTSKFLSTAFAELYRWRGRR